MTDPCAMCGHDDDCDRSCCESSGGADTRQAGSGEVHTPESPGSMRTPGPTARPVSDPSETLALIAEHRLSLEPNDEGWSVSRQHGGTILVYGSTIGEAVRACAARIKSSNQ